MLAKLRTLPIVGFFARYPLITVLLAVFVWLILPHVKDDGTPDAFGTIFTYGGTLTYAPALVFLALFLALFGRHFFYKNSIDAFAADGGFVRGWNSLSDREKVYCSLAVFAVFFLGACYIVGNVAK